MDIYGVGLKLVFKFPAGASGGRSAVKNVNGNNNGNNGSLCPISAAKEVTFVDVKNNCLYIYNKFIFVS